MKRLLIFITMLISCATHAQDSIIVSKGTTGYVTIRYGGVTSNYERGYLGTAYYVHGTDSTLALNINSGFPKVFIQPTHRQYFFDGDNSNTRFASMVALHAWMDLWFEAMIDTAINPAVGGDLTGTLPNPLVDTHKITYAKMQRTLTAARIIGSPSTSNIIGELKLSGGARISHDTLFVDTATSGSGSGVDTSHSYTWLAEQRILLNGFGNSEFTGLELKNEGVTDVTTRQQNSPAIALIGNTWSTGFSEPHYLGFRIYTIVDSAEQGGTRLQFNLFDSSTTGGVSTTPVFTIGYENGSNQIYTKFVNAYGITLTTLGGQVAIVPNDSTSSYVLTLPVTAGNYGQVLTPDGDGSKTRWRDLGTIPFLNVPTYADDAAAISGGLTSGMVYKTTTVGSTFLKIVP